MYGIIDIGSNTVRLNIYNIQGENFNLLFHHKRSAGLASYRKNGALTEAGIQKAVDTLTMMKGIASHLNLKALYSFATASIRNVSNSEEALARIQAESGLEIDLVSGKNEGRLGLKGALYGVDVSDGALFDVGGGSLEIVTFDGQDILESHSLEMGSLSGYLQYVFNILPTPTEANAIYKSARNYIRKSDLTPQASAKTAIGVGGTARAALRMYNDLYNSEGIDMEADKLAKMATDLAKDPVRARRAILRNCPDRIHTILPGIRIISAITDRLGVEDIRVSDYAVREGYLVSKIFEGINDYSDDNLIQIASRK